MKDRVDPVEAALQGGPVANVAMNKFSFGIYLLRRSIAVNLRHQEIEHAHTMALFDQGIGEMRTDKTRAARDQNVELSHPISFDMN